MLRRDLAGTGAAEKNRATMGTDSVSVKVELHERTETFVLATWRRILLLVWRGRANVEGIERSGMLFASWSTRQTGGAVFLIVVPPGRTRPPDEATRAAMARAASAPGDTLKGLATLIEAEGFIAASVRAMMMRLQSRGSRAPTQHFFRTAAEVAAWAAPLLEDRQITGEKLAEVIRLAREG